MRAGFMRSATGGEAIRLIRRCGTYTQDAMGTSHIHFLQTHGPVIPLHPTSGMKMASKFHQR